jgi:tRNA/rRNA methyltransferase
MSLPRIVLVEPNGPLNVGSIARVMKNFGLHELVLVNPQCSITSRPAQIMASHAKEVLKNSQQVSSLEEALKDCSRVIATTMRARKQSTGLETPEQVFPWILESPEPTAIMFGPEDRGLSNEDLGWAQRWICIPASTEYPTLNLAQTVGICCYELFQLLKESEYDQSDEKNALSTDNKDWEPLADVAQFNAFLEDFSALLLRAGFLYPHTANDRMNKIRRLLFRSQPSLNEVAMLRGIVSQLEWALNNPEKTETADVIR